ncbi:hypothetical protein ACQ4LE_000460 [Meloidogyne hapla]
MSNSFFVFLESNTTDYPDNQPNKFRVHLPKPLYFSGNWVCGVHSISYPFSWPSTIGTLDEQWMKIHFIDDNSKKNVLRVPVPAASHNSVEALKNYLATTLKHQSDAIGSVERPGAFIAPPSLLRSPPRAEKKIKRSAKESKSPPPYEELRSPPPLPPSPPISIPAAIPDAIDAPLVSDPNPTREITKRVKSEDSEGIKRWRKGYDAKQEEKLKQKKRKDEYLQRKNKIREQRVPIDQVALAQARREDDIKRRQKLKRKWEGPEPIERVRRVVRRPTGIRRSQRSGRIWMERLISAKRKEADIKRFRPSLW